MQVQIKETGDNESLNYIDNNGINNARDIIGNYGFEGFNYDDVSNLWVCDDETFRWWNDVFEKLSKAENRILDLTYEQKEKYYSLLNTERGSVDLEDMPAFINSLVDTSLLLSDSENIT